METGIPRGYYRNEATGGIESLPWPAKLEDLPPTLGFQVIEWIEDNLVHHLTGDPFRLTAFQKRFLVLHYAVRPNGSWRYRASTLRMAKGSGKSPMLAAMALAECLGPVRFSHWDDATDRPVGESHRLSLVVLAANSEAQAQEPLLVANAMVSDDLRRSVGYEAGKLGSATSAGCRIKLMTASVKTAEGQAVTSILHDETHHALESNGGIRIAEVAARNAAKSPGGRARVVEFTNAFEQGGGSAAERTYEAWQAQVSGKSRGDDILYASVEADPSLSFGNPEDDALIVKQAYAHSPWIDQDRILAEVYDDRTSLADSIRFYANGVAATESAWINPASWDALGRPDIEVADGEQIALFLDCSKSGDATALVGVRISDRHVITLGVWQKPHGNADRRWLAPRHEVDTAVRNAFGRYRVCWFGVDPSPATDDADDATSYWGSLIERWDQDFRDELVVWASPKSAVTFDFRQSVPGGKERFRLFTEMCAEVRQMVDEDGTITHDGHAALRAHVHNARVRTNIWGWSIGKSTRDSPKKVDLAVSMVGALVGRSLYLASGKTMDPEDYGVLYQF